MRSSALCANKKITSNSNGLQKLMDIENEEEDVVDAERKKHTK